MCPKKCIMWDIMIYTPIYTFLNIRSRVIFYLIILMCVINKHDGLVNIIQLLLSKYGIIFLNFIYEIIRDWA
jgi:hypothetical protein